MFQQRHTDRIRLGKGPLTVDIVRSTEKFICKIYGVLEVDSCNELRVFATNLKCSKVSHHAFPLWSVCLESSSLAAPWSSSSDRNATSCSCTKGCLSQCCGCRKVRIGVHWSVQLQEAWQQLPEPLRWLRLSPCVCWMEIPARNTWSVHLTPNN